MSDELTDAAIEALDHAGCLRLARPDQAMIDAELCADQIERMLARRRLFLARESVRELTAVVSEDRLDVHRPGLVETAQKVGAAGVCLIAVGAHVDPAPGTINGHKQLAPTGLIGHLWQVLDIDVLEPGLVVFERLLDRFLANDYGD